MKFFLFLPFLIFAKAMVFVDYEGQLGNQLFQTAAAYVYALENDLELAVSKEMIQEGRYHLDKNYPYFFSKIPIKNT